jgi:hypothetical protein
LLVLESFQNTQSIAFEELHCLHLHAWLSWKDLSMNSIQDSPEAAGLALLSGATAVPLSLLSVCAVVNGVFTELKGKGRERVSEDQGREI